MGSRRKLLPRSRPARSILSLIAFVCSAFAAAEFVRDQPGPAGVTAVARGQVVAIHANAVRYRFVADGEEVDGVRLNTWRLTQGVPVIVLYDPSDPRGNWSGAGDVDERREQYSSWRAKFVRSTRRRRRGDPRRIPAGSSRGSVAEELTRSRSTGAVDHKRIVGDIAREEPDAEDMQAVGVDDVLSLVQC